MSDEYSPVRPSSGLTASTMVARLVRAAAILATLGACEAKFPATDDYGVSSAEPIRSTRQHVSGAATWGVLRPVLQPRIAGLGLGFAVSKERSAKPPDRASRGRQGANAGPLCTKRGNRRAA